MRHIPIDFLATSIQQFNRWSEAEVVINCPCSCSSWLREHKCSRTRWALRTNSDRSDSAGNRYGDNGATAVLGDCDGIGYSADVYGCHAV